MTDQYPQQPQVREQPSAAPKTSTRQLVWIGLLVVTTLALWGGCAALVSSDKKPPTAAPASATGESTSSAAVTSAFCASSTPGQVPEELGGALAVGDRFDGATIRTAQMVSSSKNRTKYDLVVSLCGTEVRGHQLKVVVSDIARKVKTSPFATKVADMQVNNMQRPQTDTERSVQADFALSTFAGVAGTSEAAWKTRSER